MLAKEHMKTAIRIHPGKDNQLGWRDDRSFDIHDASGKIGFLTGYLGGPWSDADSPTEFRVTYVEITAPGRKLSPGEWQDVLDGLRENLPDVAELVGWNKYGEGGGLSAAEEKLFRLPERTTQSEFSQMLHSKPSLVPEPERGDGGRDL